MTDSTSRNSQKDEKAPKSFEDALQQLEDLVTKLEGDEVPLEESLAAFEKGQKLLRYCEEKLTKAEQVLKQLTRAGEGEPPGPS